MSEKVATVEDYKACNYVPQTAFTSALRDCERQLKDIRYRLDELAIHRAMFHDWENKYSDTGRSVGWEIVQEYIELAQDLRAISQKCEERVSENVKEEK